MAWIRMGGRSEISKPVIVKDGVLQNGAIEGNISSSNNRLNIIRNSAGAGGYIKSIKNVKGFSKLTVRGVGNLGGISYLRVIVNNITRDFPTDSVLREVEFNIAGAEVTTIQLSIANDNGSAYVTDIYAHD